VYDLIETTQVKSPSSIDDFADAVVDSKLVYRASGLLAIAIESIEELSPAIEKAMAACASYGLPVSGHFKKINISSENSAQLLEIVAAHKPGDELRNST
jgi:hypothetical protein